MSITRPERRDIRTLCSAPFSRTKRKAALVGLLKEGNGALVGKGKKSQMNGPVLRVQKRNFRDIDGRF